MIYGIPVKETVCELLEFQKEKREREMGAKSLFKVIRAENSPNLGRGLDI